jgi:hypothetical protein
LVEKKNDISEVTEQYKQTGLVMKTDITHLNPLSITHLNPLSLSVSIAVQSESLSHFLDTIIILSALNRLVLALVCGLILYSHL